MSISEKLQAEHDIQCLLRNAEETQFVAKQLPIWDKVKHPLDNIIYICSACGSYVDNEKYHQLCKDVNKIKDVVHDF